MELSITIASYNTREVTCDALASIFSETAGIDFEVIVVDNASTDGSAEMIESRFPSVQLIRSDRNLGFAAAHNLALARATGNYLLVLNSDVLFQDNAAKRMVDDLQTAHKPIGAIGPQILNLDGSFAPSSRRRIFYSRALVGLSAVNQFFPFGQLLPLGLLRRSFGKVLGRVHDTFDPPATPQEVEWLDGMCVLFRREALEQAGLFDEQFFFDFEIGDLLIRVRSLGWGILIDPTIRIIHLGGCSRKKVPRLLVQNLRSFLIYYAKHKPIYIPMVRKLYEIVLQLKLWFLKAWLQLSSGREELQETIQILEEVRRVFVDFDPTSVKENSRIPRLPSVGPLITLAKHSNSAPEPALLD